MDQRRYSTFQKINKGLEYFWLVITVACTGMAIWFIANDGYDQAKWYLLFPLLSMAMYIMRRGLRKRFEAGIRQQQQAEAEAKSKPKPQ